MKFSLWGRVSEKCIWGLKSGWWWTYGGQTLEVGYSGDEGERGGLSRERQSGNFLLSWNLNYWLCILIIELAFYIDMAYCNWLITEHCTFFNCSRYASHKKWDRKYLFCEEKPQWNKIHLIIAHETKLQHISTPSMIYVSQKLGFPFSWSQQPIYHI